MTIGNDAKGTQEEVKIVRTADHRSHYAIGAIAQWSEDDLRLHIYNEVVEGQGGPYHISTAQIIIPKTAIGRFLATLETAARMEGRTSGTRVAEVPKELAFRTRQAQKEVGAPSKKKVMKIRKA